MTSDITTSIRDAQTDAPLTGRAIDLLVDADLRATPHRIGALRDVLRSHPGAWLETCGDERTGARFGQALCRQGRCCKIGHCSWSPGLRINPYQIWAVWPHVLSPVELRIRQSHHAAAFEFAPYHIWDAGRRCPAWIRKPRDRWNAHYARRLPLRTIQEGKLGIQWYMPYPTE